MVWFAGSGIVSRINTEQQMNTIGQLTTLARSAGDVVHQLQSERGMSAGFIGARGQKFRDDLAAQRQLTDKVLATFKRLLTDTNKDLLQGNIAAPLKTFNESIQFLDSTRTAISELTIDSPKASQFYTQTISDVLKFVGGMGHLSTPGSMGNELGAYYSLLNLKEKAGVERALLSNIFSMDRFDDGQFSMFSDVVGQQDAWLTAARSFSTPVQAAELDKSLQSAEATRALELRETAFNKAAEGGFIKSRLPQFKSTSCFSGLKRFVQLSRLHRCAKAASCRQPGILLAYHIAKHAELAVVKAIHREDIGQQRTFYTSLLLQIQETIISRQFVLHRAGGA
ncbi:Methyl-accepting chemotaxis protein CDS [Salmonella enterica subsp. enterica serovar Derby]|nr:Methyl-accepting chemotaxis protein CDS [Salmonella enterica subsp. enterica serovar Derby]